MFPSWWMSRGSLASFVSLMIVRRQVYFAWPRLRFRCLKSEAYPAPFGLFDPVVDRDFVAAFPHVDCWIISRARIYRVDGEGIGSRRTEKLMRDNFCGLPNENIYVLSILCEFKGSYQMEGFNLKTLKYHSSTHIAAGPAVPLDGLESPSQERVKLVTLWLRNLTVGCF